MLPRSPLNDRIGFALTRIIVPLWIFLGVYFKMEAGTAANLPSTIRTFSRNWLLNLDFVLYTLIGLEIFAILVMLFIARLARPMAIFMLSVFCLILVGEIIKGADKCGCFGGTINIEPWQMLIADGVLLAGVILFRPPHKKSAPTETTPDLTSDVPGGRKTRILTPQAIAATTLALILGLAASFILGNILHGGEQPQPKRPNGDIVIIGGTLNPYTNPSPRNPPRNWYPQNLPTWIGKPWREIEIFQFMPQWPEGLDEGRQYIVFYSRTCAHCEVMFHEDFTQPLGAPVIAIQIPASRTELTGSAPNVWELPPDLHTGITLIHLPIGPDWSLLTPPLAMRIDDGVVTCANEGDHKECFEID